MVVVWRKQQVTITVVANTDKQNKMYISAT